MQHLMPQPKRRRSVPRQVQRLISYAWIITSLALPVIGVALVAGGELAPVDTATTTHTVRAGDTLSAIARRYGVTVDEIVQSNGLNNPDLIYVGQVLTIPLRAPQAPEGAAVESYTVQRGDTLSAIARRYGVTVDAIAQANGLANRNSIYAGQKLAIPGVSVVEVTSPETLGMSYTLQRGDSLYRLSLIYGVSVDALLAANDLASPNAIYPGLEIRIPDPRSAVAQAGESAPPAGLVAGEEGPRTYTVQWGDTLARIALRYDVTVDGLVAANGLTRPDRIYVGQMLNIPAPGASARPAPAQTATSHVVRAGETLSQIALRYGVTLHSLAVANGIQDVARIYVGMILTIPSAQAGSNSVRYASVGQGLCPDVEPRRSGTGYFIRPTRNYILTQRYHPWHPGVDLALDIGNDVYAADGGTVVFSGWNPVGYGNLVVLDHGNGWRTYYAHLSAVNVGCGEWVPRGAILGQVGSTGNSTGPHLHFEMLRFGIAVDPAGYIRF